MVASALLYLQQEDWMKKLSALLLVVSLFGFACETRETRVEGNTTTYEVETTTIDDNAVRSTETALSTAGDAAGDALRDAGEATGTALQEAGRELQEHSKPGNQP
jgi:hypothetical protein